MKLKSPYIFLAIAATSGVASAASIGLSFGGAGGGADVTLLSSDSAGVVRQTNWNTNSAASGTINNLNDDSGTATDVRVTWSSDESWSYTGSGTHGTTDAGLFAGWISENGGVGSSSTIDISGVSYGQYDIYVYVSHDRINNGARITIGSTTYDISEHVDVSKIQASPWVYTNGAGGSGSYVKFSGLTGRDQTISFTTPAASGDEAFRVGIAGFQIVEVVPEPSSTTLLGLGGLALILRRRK